MLCKENSTRHYLIWEKKYEIENEIKNDDITKVIETEAIMTMKALIVGEEDHS